MGIEREKLFDIFIENANPQNAETMSAYMRRMFPFLGIKTPDRRNLTRNFFQADEKSDIVDWTFVREAWEKPEREYQYAAADYLAGKTKFLKPEDLPSIVEIALKKAWWDTIDGLSSTVGVLVIAYPELRSRMLEFSEADSFWIRRIAILHQLNAGDRLDKALLEKILANNLYSSEFFINKAIGWALRTVYRTDEVWVETFLASHEGIASLTRREALKHKKTDAKDK